MEQPEALRLAEELEMIAPNECKALIVNSAAQELRRLHTRVQELEAELEATRKDPFTYADWPM